MKSRLHLLDALRGWTLLNMIAYHGMWNLAHLYGKNLPGYTGPTGTNVNDVAVVLVNG